jgi:hypothetical protein
MRNRLSSTLRHRQVPPHSKKTVVQLTYQDPGCSSTTSSQTSESIYPTDMADQLSYQNHRRYVQSFDADQLKGDAKSACVNLSSAIRESTDGSRSSIDDGNCKPITSSGDKPYYPCGLIANSVFNGEHTSYRGRSCVIDATDSFPQVVLLNPTSESCLLEHD